MDSQYSNKNFLSKEFVSLCVDNSKEAAKRLGYALTSDSIVKVIRDSKTVKHLVMLEGYKSEDLLNMTAGKTMTTGTAFTTGTASTAGTIGVSVSTLFTLSSVGSVSSVDLRDAVKH